MTNPKFTNLYGKKLLQFKFKLSSTEGLFASSHSVTVDKYHSNIRPANGCDMIIGRSSTNSSRVYSLNPNIIDTISVSTLNDHLEIGLIGYVDSDDYQELLSMFKVQARTITKTYIKNKMNQLNYLDSVLKSEF
jgi:hypothetical protein